MHISFLQILCIMFESVYMTSMNNDCHWHWINWNEATETLWSIWPSKIIRNLQAESLSHSQPPNPWVSCQLSHWHCLIPSFYSARTLIVQILLCHHSPAEGLILPNLVQRILSGWFIEMYDLLQDSIASDCSFEWYSPLSPPHARRFCGFGISIQMQVYTSVGIITQPVYYHYNCY